MKKLLLFSTFVFLVSTAFSQYNPVVASSVPNAEKQTHLELTDNGVKGLDLNYSFENSVLSTINEKGTSYTIPNRTGFSFTKDIGKPAVPAHNEIIAVPLGATASIKFHKLVFHDEAGYLCYPAQPPAPDTYGAPEPEFVIDEEFYTRDTYYPSNPVEIVERLKWRGMELLVLQIRPVRYNPKKHKFRMYSKLEFSIEFEGGSDFVDANQHSQGFLERYPAALLNKASIEEEISKKREMSQPKDGDGKDYIIITVPDYYTVAEKLAAWKRQLGYKVEIVEQANWTSQEVKTAIETRYQNWTPKPDYFVIIGDHQDVPGQNMGSHVTDLYYACMDGSGDYWPDMARGRISVASESNASLVIDKIIKYEAQPVTNAAFYSRSTHAAYFQESAQAGYAERRFAQTAEDIRQYMTNQQGMNVDRVYYTGSSTTPTNWNNGYYSSGEPLPSYLLKPTFPWTGDATDINNNINAGNLYVLHRDHGWENGWGDPYYDISNINSLNNGDLTPIVFSINCLTGKFNETECFSERFLRKTPGGAVGIFCHSEVSYSGYNDGLAIGLFDAIWASPGLVPNFTGSGGINNPNVTPHEPILTMGDVATHGLIRMSETWGTNQYTNELFHYFGDPAMKIWTQVPQPITATFSNTIMCGTDSVIHIYNSTVLDATATLVVDGILMDNIVLVNGEGFLHFTPVVGVNGFITLSAGNHKPLVAPIYILGGCPKSKFDIGPSHFCPSDSVWFESVSTGTITDYVWNFGPGATPQTATSLGPHSVYYSTPGPKTISLEVTGPSGNDTYERQIEIDSDCKFYMPTSGTAMSSFCYGVLFDDGGSGNYSDNINSTFVIEPDGSSGITLYFSEFDFEQDWDTLWIYDGDISTANLIGGFTGSNLPMGGVVSTTSGKVTIIQQTDQAVNESGFEVAWTCNYPNSPPHSNFMCMDVNPCLGEAAFYDISTNVPDTWEWDFGDGNFSAQQNPIHTYETNGVFSVTLVASNSFGSDTVTYHSFLEIDRPMTPEIQDSVAICGPGTVDLSAISAGTTLWYESASDPVPVNTGAQLQVTVDSSRLYFVENRQPGPSEYGAKYNDAGDGAFYSYATIHYLVFDVYEEFMLKSVKVYADGDGDRTIYLRGSNGATLETATVFIPDGESRVDLNWLVAPGTEYQLAAQAAPYLFRNLSSLSYPYDIAGMGSVTHSSATSDPTGYYYFFYDWEVVGPDCYSPRIPYSVFVMDDVPEAAFSFDVLNDSVVAFTNSSTDAISYTWYFGDGASSQNKNPQHVFATIGHYDVMLVATNPCGDDTISATIAVGIENVENPADAIAMFPNPTNHEVTLVLPNASSEEIDLCLYNITGQCLNTWKLDKRQVRVTLSMDKYSPGIYWLRIGDSLSKKLVIQR
ncbi:MAG: PKD domain-containing protein [Bacteroidales bacterium]|nr:PKD domain-containing protein [Bacteroidales bacterium]MCF8455882.1 PKD domain-containing protein [Bacteroidales bacterium]